MQLFMCKNRRHAINCKNKITKLKPLKKNKKNKEILYQ